jgi:hypothetical protein
LKPEDDWYCQKCVGALEYFVVFDIFGGHIIHDSQIPLITEPEGQTYWQVPYDGPLFGPFTKEEAETVLEEKNHRMRKNV